MNMLLNENLTTLSVLNVIILSITAICLGLIMAKVHTYKNDYNKSFVITLAMLPLTIQLVILLVNGNVGTGVAVMGAFSLVRFRSLPGTAKEIGSIFASMAVGLACGTGQIYIAIIFTVIFSVVALCYEGTGLWKSSNSFQQLKITIPEDLYKVDVFKDILEVYTLKYELVGVKTTNMGSLFQLEFKVNFDESKDLKKFLNELRCRNGNLDINFNLVVNSYNGL
ncbi:MAG: DUF4956 domain-containing protein [Lachnospirales bacterium]